MTRSGTVEERLIYWSKRHHHPTIPTEPNRGKIIASLEKWSVFELLIYEDWDLGPPIEPNYELVIYEEWVPDQNELPEQFTQVLFEPWTS